MGNQIDREGSHISAISNNTRLGDLRKNSPALGSHLLDSPLIGRMTPD
jgi:hypothetical protein